QLALPPFVDPHVHLDSTLTAGQPEWNESGTLFDGIRIWSERKKTLTHQDVKDRALKALKMQASHGVQFVRSHVDVTDPELVALKALIE
ncbi:amidohydrolase family protein, partial [Acinetobacter baumannii]